MTLAGLEWGELALVVVAVVLGFSVKGVTGIGGPMLAIPVLAAFRGVEYAVAVITIPAFLANCWLLWKNRDARAEADDVALPLLVSGIVGAAVGSWVLVVADNSVLLLLLAGLVLAYVVLSLVNPSFRLSVTTGRRLGVPVGLVGGWFQGATGISAPVFATYLHALGLARQAFVFAVTLLFAVNGVVQLVSLTALGGYDGGRVVAGLVASVPSLVVLPWTNRLGDRLNVQVFRRVVLAMLAASAIALIVGAL
jgi:uncharacterized membrane protein YfcA